MLHFPLYKCWEHVFSLFILIIIVVFSSTNCKLTWWERKHHSYKYSWSSWILLSNTIYVSINFHGGHTQHNTTHPLKHIQSDSRQRHAWKHWLLVYEMVLERTRMHGEKSWIGLDKPRELAITSQLHEQYFSWFGYEARDMHTICDTLISLYIFSQW